MKRGIAFHATNPKQQVIRGRISSNFSRQCRHRRYGRESRLETSENHSHRRGYPPGSLGDGVVDHPIRLHLPLSTSRRSLLLVRRPMQPRKFLASPLEPPRLLLSRKRPMAAQITLNPYQTEPARTLVLFFIFIFPLFIAFNAIRVPGKQRRNYFLNKETYMDSSTSRHIHKA
jgi:hypothetical protein